MGISGRRTWSLQPSRPTLPRRRASMCAWATKNAEGKMVIASFPQPTVTAATSTPTMGDKTFYGPGPEFQVNTQQPFKVVTRFHAPDGVLTGIEQFYVQNGQEIPPPNHAALGNTNIETDESCAAQKEAFGDRNRFAEEGGMKAMGEALDRGMVLVISMWDDIAVNMNWLDAYMG